MKLLLGFFSVVSAGIVAVTLLVSPAYPAGLCFDRASGTSAFKECDEDSDSPTFVLQCGGSYHRTFEKEFSEEFVTSVEEKLEGSVLHYSGEPDYKSFAFVDRMTPLNSPLSDEEVAFVFSEIVSSCTPSVPIKGKLTDLTFLSKGSALTARAEITLDLEKLKEAYRVSFLPPCATFVLVVHFLIKNSDISVVPEQIELSCEQFHLPKALLIFGCNAAFGKKDYQELFGKALENVFVNAGVFTRQPEGGSGAE